MAAELTDLDRLLADATASALAAWPTLAGPLVDALADGASVAPAAVVDGLAADLTGRMLQVATSSAALVANDAAAQGIDEPSGEPDRDRIEHLAATFAGLIASGYAATAVQASLGVPLAEGPRLKAAAAGVKAAVRTALTALGSAVRGLVPTHVGAAMAAAEHEGARSVYEAHPPRYLVAAEPHDVDRCEPCTEVNGQRYETLADALEDYPTVGYRLCKGGIRCRGRLRGVWSEDPKLLTESAPAALVEASDGSVHTGAMLALIPTSQDAARLAVDGGEDPDELHCTIAYLGKADQLDAAARQALIASVTAACTGMPVVDADVFAAALFNPGGDEPCLVALLSGDLLDAVHHFLLETVALPPVGQHAPWIPHVTLRYGDDVLRLSGALAATAGRMQAGQVGPVRFDRLRIAFAGELVDIPLLPGDTAGDDDDGFDAWLADEGLVEADDHPGDGKLKRYWLGRGADRWTASPHPWTSLYRHLRKYIKNPVLLKKTVSRWYIDFFHHTPNQKHVSREAASTRPALVEVAIVESGAITDLNAGDEPLTDDELALVTALDELDADLVEVFDPAQARYPKGHPKGGQFRSMVDRIKDSISAHKRGEHPGKHPLDGYSREQLRRVARARGIDLKRGEDRDSIAQKLLDDHHGAGKAKPKKAHAAKAVAKVAPQSKPSAELSQAERLAQWRADAAKPGRVRQPGNGPTKRDVYVASWDKSIADTQAQLDKAEVSGSPAERERLRSHLNYLVGARDAVRNNKDPKLDELDGGPKFALAQQVDKSRPLAVYGDVLNFDAAGDDWAAVNLTELEKVPAHVHGTVAAHLAERETGGIWIGESGVPDLDDAHDLAGEQPRGWTAGSTWAEVGGAFRPDRRQLLIGRTANSVHRGGHTATHEFGHALDRALGNPSHGAEWGAIHQEALRGTYLSPYYRQEGGAGEQEFFAEAVSSWASARQFPPGSAQRSTVFMAQLQVPPGLADRIDAYFERLLGGS
ncbi:hypothetical protein [Dactylosporangium salmoneum]|uniref:hypothetical protein n=1 Tax=Dactylosporangium salmoneum TaxID=53361 RepID=UPI0031E12FE3